MSTADLLSRAQSALLTNQPNLAMLYMSKAHGKVIWDRVDNGIKWYEALRTLKGI